MEAYHLWRHEQKPILAYYAKMEYVFALDCQKSPLGNLVKKQRKSQRRVLQKRALIARHASLGRR